MIKDSVSISGYGPDTLLEELRKAEWKRFPGGSNFEAIVLAGSCLTESGDAICSAKYIVTVISPTTRESFIIGGYAHPDIISSIKEEMGENKLGNSTLLPSPAPGIVEYRIAVALIG